MINKYQPTAIGYSMQKVIRNAAITIILQEFDDDNGLRNSCVFCIPTAFCTARGKFSIVRFCAFMCKLVWFISVFILILFLTIFTFYVV